MGNQPSLSSEASSSSASATKSHRLDELSQYNFFAHFKSPDVTAASLKAFLHTLTEKQRATAISKLSITSVAALFRSGVYDMDKIDFLEEILDNTDLVNSHVHGQPDTIPILVLFADKTAPADFIKEFLKRKPNVMVRDILNRHAFRLYVDRKQPNIDIVTTLLRLASEQIHTALLAPVSSLSKFPDANTKTCVSIGDYVSEPDLHQATSLTISLVHEHSFEIMTKLLDTGLDPYLLEQVIPAALGFIAPYSTLNSTIATSARVNALGVVCSRANNAKLVTLMLSRSLIVPRPYTDTICAEYRHLVHIYAQFNFPRDPVRSTLVLALQEHYNPFIRYFFTAGACPLDTESSAPLIKILLYACFTLLQLSTVARLLSPKNQTALGDVIRTTFESFDEKTSFHAANWATQGFYQKKLFSAKSILVPLPLAAIFGDISKHIREYMTDDDVEVTTTTNEAAINVDASTTTTTDMTAIVDSDVGIVNHDTDAETDAEIDATFETMVEASETIVNMIDSQVAMWITPHHERHCSLLASSDIHPQIGSSGHDFHQINPLSIPRHRAGLRVPDVDLDAVDGPSLGSPGTEPFPLIAVLADTFLRTWYRLVCVWNYALPRTPWAQVEFRHDNAQLLAFVRHFPLRLDQDNGSITQDPSAVLPPTPKRYLSNIGLFEAHHKTASTRIELEPFLAHHYPTTVLCASSASGAEMESTASLTETNFDSNLYEWLTSLPSAPTSLVAANSSVILPLAFLDSISIFTSGAVFENFETLFAPMSTESWFSQRIQSHPATGLTPIVNFKRVCALNEAKAAPDQRLGKLPATLMSSRRQVPGLVWYGLYYSTPSFDDVYTLVSTCRTDILSANGETCLMIAILKRWPRQALQAMLNSTVSINHTDNAGRTLLHYYFMSGAWEAYPDLFLQLIFIHGAVVNVLDDFGQTPLSYALLNLAPVKIVELLINLTLTILPIQYTEYYQYHMNELPLFSQIAPLRDTPELVDQVRRLYCLGDHGVENASNLERNACMSVPSLSLSTFNSFNDTQIGLMLGDNSTFPEAPIESITIESAQNNPSLLNFPFFFGFLTQTLYGNEFIYECRTTLVKTEGQHRSTPRSRVTHADFSYQLLNLAQIAQKSGFTSDTHEYLVSRALFGVIASHSPLSRITATSSPKTAYAIAQTGTGLAPISLLFQTLFSPSCFKTNLGVPQSTQQPEYGTMLNRTGLVLMQSSVEPLEEGYHGPNGPFIPSTAFTTIVTDNSHDLLLKFYSKLGIFITRG